MIILVGPSASGKTQIGYSLKKIYGLEKVVTYTTRRMRSGEVNGIDYHLLLKMNFYVLKKKIFSLNMFAITIIIMGQLLIL